MNATKVWIVDDDSSIRWVMQKALDAADISNTSFESPLDLLDALKNESPDVVISDIRMPEMDGMELLEQIHQQDAEIPVIIMTAHSDLDSAVNAYQSGAFEYLPKPFDIDDAVSLTQRALTHVKENSRKKRSRPKEEQISTDIIGEAPAMQEVFRAIGRLSRSSISVLINGQSGTGKELVARALHKHSPRRDKTFIALNMAAIPNDLIESELFGHEKGAFTGANAVREGRFEQANGGTLFLDEIGDMPLQVQTRLLRVLADGQFYRVGGRQPLNADVRIIAATHQNLEKLVAEGKFREDLFHRLNVIRIHLPPLRERKEDIPRLAAQFLQQAAKEMSVEEKRLSQEAADYISQLDWPGNVRQLENTCRWLTVMASGQEVLITDLPPELLDAPAPTLEATSEVSGDWQTLLTRWVDEQLASGKNDILDDALATFETIMLKRALHHTMGHKQEAARRLGWGRNTITRKMKELNI
ncbi:Fis family nitrogen metabolism transcriptional regulator NtrC [Catenovulum agarivorans DS-2]|uniref:DNA-binding transcriptional regulator NtrC n=1 Tax=Catenovulum agarivorans DS-2 TaxID=1328313 RepID=W7QIT3_9ALTE|nr:nitrogen regulation protein NR(I) [Catenovulum agarivorans]EWH11766.1 Fis family nitrogen metabolism transcriptional regulator NtrC [Catenovulum agarivorans DS-2]